MSRNKDWLTIKQTSTMGQDLANDHPQFKEYMGSDVKLAKRIALFNVMVKHKLLTRKDVALVKDIMIEQNRATFASSDKTDNLTKISLGLGKDEVPPADGSK
jgi:hypothetical protein